VFKVKVMDLPRFSLGGMESIFFFSTYIYGVLKFHQRVQVTGIGSNYKITFVVYRC